MTAADIARIFRAEAARAVTVLYRLFGDLDLAEEAVQDAFAAALERWPASGLPPNPQAWLLTTARNRAIDRVRRESSRAERHATAMVLQERDEPLEASAVNDDVLRLLFTCCHPALAMPARVALTLRLVGGLTTPEIAHAFLVPEATLAQRLVRAKAKIRDARIPFRIPEESELADRMAGVLSVVYLVFNEGYLASAGDALIREELCAEAIRLSRLLHALRPEDPEVRGLLALMLLIEARRAARTRLDGRLVRLADQNRGLWDRTLIDEGQALVRRCLERNEPGPYQLQAAIQAVHSDAATARETDWRQIVALYDHLLALAPGPVVALNRAVAVAELEGPESGLGLVDALALEGYPAFHTVRAELLRRQGRRREAAAAYDRALALTSNAAERASLRERRASLDDEGEGSGS